MKAEDIFLGPMLRRCERGLVTIVLASYVPLKLRFSVKLEGREEWLAHDDLPFSVKVSEALYFYFGLVKPLRGGTPFPTGKLLSYSIGVLKEWMVQEPAPEQIQNPPPLQIQTDSGGTLSGEAPPDEEDEVEHYPDSYWDYEAFEDIVAEDGLAYGEYALPTFFLQAFDRKLNIIHGSCRKPHDADPDHAGAYDAMALGDGLISKFASDLSQRPAIGCWGGDQIYADDVHEDTFHELARLAARIEGAKREVLPDSLSLPEGGTRQEFLKEHAAFTSTEAKYHLITLAEYLAMYGLVWNDRNWSASYDSLKAFRSSLGAVRRMLANLPTYMIFDDHDVTDDWNLSLGIQEKMRKKALGHQIVGNALIAFWLCQGYANDPRRYVDDAGDWARVLGAGIEARLVDVQTFRNLRRVFWDELADLNLWEFSTPTKPAIYFLDTRTQRGARDDEASRKDLTAPAYLKSVDSWKKTRVALQGQMAGQGVEDTLLVIVAAAPILGFGLIEWGQSLVGSIDPTVLDMESWSANRQQFLFFMEMLGGCNVVVLSGDVHYGFTASGKFHEFDCGQQELGGSNDRRGPVHESFGSGDLQGGLYKCNPANYQQRFDELFQQADAAGAGDREGAGAKPDGFGRLCR